MSEQSLLIIEDDGVIRDLLKSALSGNFRILEASTYLDSMRFPPQYIDMAIIDYCLPDRDGFDVLQSLRVKNPAMPAIMITGYSDEELILRALRNNVTDYIKKPLDLGYLRKRVADILREKNTGDHVSAACTRNRNLDTVARYVQSNYMEEITLDKLARMACMSRCGFSRAFKERYNQCYVSYLNSIRLKNAGALLTNSHATITEIAFSVGYKNAGHFNRVFKAAYSTSPREYRRKKISEE